MRAIVRAWRARGLSVALASPTARGARVLGDAVGDDVAAIDGGGSSAKTLHRLLEVRVSRDDAASKEMASPKNYE